MADWRCWRGRRQCCGHRPIRRLAPPVHRPGSRRRCIADLHSDWASIDAPPPDVHRDESWCDCRCWGRVVQRRGQCAGRDGGRGMCVPESLGRNGCGCPAFMYRLAVEAEEEGTNAQPAVMTVLVCSLTRAKHLHSPAPCVVPFFCLCAWGRTDG
jgi:hypothetical protein